ncbi:MULTISPECIES: L-threonylcarbamoyladenylate synthase [Mesoplasma]|uniref:L-threonylcarbamoyladenylate synthase n=1 Tax=Mesoplasma florum TaxID=2151 RepID=A0A2R3P871_MESFO|nr:MULTISPECIES: Sua5/YciO/YrdC/YwlC family protein [Mesoplasma]AVN64686.1 translation factor [Mesoplasma florum]
MLSKDLIIKATNALIENEIIILPTDTIYGLSAIWNFENEKRINGLKNANKEKPLIVLISNIEQLSILGIEENKFVDLLFNESTTVIFKTKSNNKTIAVRLIIRNDIKKIIEKTGPIFSTSVNLHGEQPINEKDELINFDSSINVYFDKVITNNKPSKIYNSITNIWVR